MTHDQERQLIKAINNVEDLVAEEDFTKLIKEIIAILTGAASELEEEMPRTKGSTNKKKNGTSAEVVSVPTSVVVPDQNRDQLIAEWKQAADQLAEVKAKEAALRQAIVVQMFDGTKLEGSESVDIGYGWQLRAKKELAYNASDEEAKRLERLLMDRKAPIETMGLFRWKPDVAKKIYRMVLALAEQYQDTEILAALHAAITLKPGMPQLEMVPPPATGYPTDMPATVEAPTFVLETDFVPE